MNTTRARLLLTLTLLTLVAMTPAHAQLLPSVNPYQNTLPSQMTSITQTLNTLPSSAEAVLFAPSLTRADVAEALRQAMLNQGTVVSLITTREGLYNAGGVAFHLALAGARVYLVKQPPDSLPFIATASQVAEGQGVATPGPAYTTSPARAQALRQWARAVTLRTAPVELPLMVHTWIETVMHIKTR